MPAEWAVGRCQLVGNSKGQCTISKILFPLLLHTFIEQNIFFPQTCFAYLISEQKFTVWRTIARRRNGNIHFLFLKTYKTIFFCHGCVRNIRLKLLDSTRSRKYSSICLKTRKYDFFKFLYLLFMFKQFGVYMPMGYMFSK